MLIDDMIPELKDWRRGNANFSIFDYIGLRCNYAQIIAISRLFFPELVFIEGCVFLRDSCQKSDIERFYNHAETAADFEKAMNFVCLKNLIPVKDERDGALVKEIVDLIKKSWSMYFEKEFKEYALVVNAYEDEYDGWCVTFYQEKNVGSRKPSKVPTWVIS
jgi:hypothetical protein